MTTPQRPEHEGGEDRPADYSHREGEMPDGILDLVRKPDVQDRSKEFFKVVCALKKRGWSPAEIEALFADHPDGIASKYSNRLRQEVDRVYHKEPQEPGGGHTFGSAAADDPQEHEFNREVRRLAALNASATKRKARESQRARRKGAGPQKSAGKEDHESPRGERGGKPRLRVDGANPDKTVEQLRDILAASGQFFDRGEPVRVIYDSSQGGSIAQPLTPDAVVLMAHQLCRPYSVKAQPNGERFDIDARLPKPIAAMYLDWRGEWCLPVLKGISSAPRLDDDGSIRCGQGYDPSSAMWLENVPDVAALVPARPTREDAARALRLIRETYSVT
jgi:hypothetical protein